MRLGTTPIGLCSILLVLSATGAVYSGDRGIPQAAGEKWIRKYNGPGNYNDVGRAIAVDKSGNVYVAGESPGSGTYRDYAVLKYNKAGQLLWEARYNGTGNGDDYAYAIAVDGAGNVYVTGSSAGKSSGNDFATVKYDKSGKLVWAKRFSGAGNRGDAAFAIAVDGKGNVYVTGESVGATSQRDILTIKYSSAGNQVWVKRYNGQGNGDDSGFAIALDSAGNAHVSGYTQGSDSGMDFIVIKY